MITTFRSIILSGGNKCFIRCPGCYNYFGKSEYSSDNLIHFLDQAKRILGLSKVTMAGGDPLIRKDIVELLSRIKSLGYNLNLDTVGLSFIKDVNLLNGHKVKQISPTDIMGSVDVIGIPLDGSTNDINQIFRQKLEVLDVKEILNTLSRHEAYICVNTVLHSGNKRDIANIYNTIQKYKGVKKWQIFEFMPSGPGGFKNREKYELEVGEFEFLTNELKQEIGSTHIEIQCKSRGLRKNKYLLIDGDGAIWVPRQSVNEAWDPEDGNNERVVLGNLSEENIFDITLSKLQSLEEKSNEVVQA